MVAGPNAAADRSATAASPPSPRQIAGNIPVQCSPSRITFPPRAPSRSRATRGATGHGHLTAAPSPANDDVETFGLQSICHTASSSDILREQAVKSASYAVTVGTGGPVVLLPDEAVPPGLTVPRAVFRWLFLGHQLRHDVADRSAQDGIGECIHIGRLGIDDHDTCARLLGHGHAAGDGK